MNKISSPPLKIGLLLDSFKQPAWIYHAIKSVLNSAKAEATVLIFIANKPASTRRPASQDSWQVTGLAAPFLLAMDRAIFIRRLNALEQKDIQDLTSDSQPIQIDTTGDDGLEILKGRLKDPLDIVLNFSDPVLDSRFSAAARYGCWSFSPYDQENHPAGLWEVLEDEPFTRASLLMTGPGSLEARILQRSETITHPISPARNRNMALWACAMMLPRQISLLHRLGAERYFAMVEQRHRAMEGPFPTRTVLPADERRRSAGVVWGYFIRQLKGIYARLFLRNTWQLSFRFHEDALADLRNFSAIEPARGNFWADPNVLAQNGSYHIFFEEYSFRQKRGWISVISLDESGNSSRAVKVLEKPYHLSFPFVFKHQHKIFMLPESAQNRSIDLYECEDFPHKWKYKMTLMDGVLAVDSTLLFYRQKWWLFTAMAEHEGTFPQVELFIFHSADLFSRDWQPHRLNPVVSEISRARPAGRVFMQDQTLYRPSQYCCNTYGFGFDINKILTLSEDEYEEQVVQSLRPGWDREVLAMHTYAREGDLTVIDIMKRNSVFDTLAIRR